MSGRQLVITFLLCVSGLHPPEQAVAQEVKSSYDKSADFKKYKKYTWGANYLLTRQPKDVQERINKAIIDSINRNLQASGFIEDDSNPDFKIIYEAGGLPQADVGPQLWTEALPGGKLTCDAATGPPRVCWSRLPSWRPTTSAAATARQDARSS